MFGELLELVGMGAKYLRGRKSAKEAQSIYRKASAFYDEEIMLNEVLGQMNMSYAWKSGIDAAKDISRKTTLAMGSQIVELSNRGVGLGGSSALMLLSTANLGIEAIERTMASSMSESVRSYFAKETTTSELRRKKEKALMKEKEIGDSIFDMKSSLVSAVGNKLSQMGTPKKDAKGKEIEGTGNPFLQGIGSMAQGVSEGMDLYQIFKGL